MYNTNIVYPALVYKNNKTNQYVANCIMKNLIGFGHTETDAVRNLEKVLNQYSKDYPIKIRPVNTLFSELELSRQEKI